MPVTVGPPLKKITLNLYHDDILALKSRYGHGYTEQIRQIIHDNILSHRQAKRTIEDYVKEDLDE